MKYAERHEWWQPKAWPLWARRAFLITLPISGPLWLASVTVGAITFAIFLLCIAAPGLFFFYLKDELWDKRAGEEAAHH